MRFNISAAKALQRSEAAWYYQYHLGRVPKRQAPALAAGTFAHQFFELLHTGIPNDRALARAQVWLGEHRRGLLVEGFAEQVEKLDQESDILLELLPHWQDRFEFTTLQVEQELEAPLPSGSHILYGTPDRVALWQDKLWHVQNRTLSSSTPMGPYLKAAQLDLHELGYAWLINNSSSCMCEEWSNYPYGGTLFNIVRKLKLTGAKGKPLHHPEECFIQEFLPVNPKLVRTALEELERLGNRMVKILQEEPEPNFQGRICPAHCTLGKYGNSLCGYFPVCSGQTTIEDDTLYEDAKPREGAHAL